MKPQQLYYIERRGPFGDEDRDISFVLYFWPDQETVGSKAFFAMRNEPRGVIWAESDIADYAERMLELGRWKFSKLRNEHMLIKDIFGDLK